MQVQPWHDAGVDGSGVKIAIFDTQWFHTDLALDELGEVTTHDCYRHRSCDLEIDSLHPRFSWETGAHGVACAEVIHDIAPGAELHLVRVNGLTSLENAVDWAIRDGVDVISMSLSFFNESFYDGYGDVNAAMDRLAAADVLMVTSAGNYAREHWTAPFSDDDADGLHEFPWGSEYLPLYYGAGGHSVNLIWDDFNNCGDTDLNAYIYSADGQLLGRSDTVQEPGGEDCHPSERVSFSAPADDWYYMLIHRAGGDGAVQFDVMARGGEAWQAMVQGSITDPGTHPDVFTVGAVRADGYGTNRAEEFSSQGPTAAGLDKPDIAGPDGLTTTTYGSTGFYGTSAATPAVVGALALLMSEDPTLTSRDAANRLQQTALTELGPHDKADPELGAGRARLASPGARLDGCQARHLIGLSFVLPILGLRRRPPGR